MRILFVCEGNIHRSQMAGAIYESLVPEAKVETAGVYAGRAGERLADVSKESIAAMKERGFDISENLITQLTPALVEHADTIILVGEIPGGPIPGYLKDSRKLETWDVPDPGYGHISIAGARDMILERVKKLAAGIRS